MAEEKKRPTLIKKTATKGGPSVYTPVYYLTPHIITYYQDKMPDGKPVTRVKVERPLDWLDEPIINPEIEQKSKVKQENNGKQKAV